VGDELDDESEHGEETYDAREIQTLGGHGLTFGGGRVDSGSVLLIDESVSYFRWRYIIHPMDDLSGCDRAEQRTERRGIRTLRPGNVIA
jgi:hypothetical protein